MQKITRDAGKSDELIVHGLPVHPMIMLLNRIPKKIWTFSAVAVFLMVSILIAQKIQDPQILRIQAQLKKATISIQPKDSILVRDSAYQIWITNEQPVAFVQMELTFNPDQLILTEEITLTQSNLSKKILVTNKDQANTTGKITIIIGSDPMKKSPLRVGTLKIADLQFAPKTTTNNISAAITFNSSALQILGFDGQPFAVIARNATVSVNPAQMAVPTSTPVPTPVTTGIPTPTITPMTPRTSVNPTFYPVDLITPISTITVEKVPGINPPIR